MSKMSLRQNEIRLGNIVMMRQACHPVGNVRYTERRIKFMASDLKHFDIYATPPAIFVGIPLTEGIMNDVIGRSDNWPEWDFSSDCAWSIMSYGEQFGLAYGGDLSKTTWVRYVHELQNLYYVLMGEELMIDERDLKRSVANPMPKDQNDDKNDFS